MPFQKGNKLGAKQTLKVKADGKVIGFRGRKGQLAKLKEIPQWQELLRDYVDEIIESHKIQQESKDLGGTV